jgi:hypothetical protein
MTRSLLTLVALGAPWLAPIASAADDLELARATAEANVPQTWITLAAVADREAISLASLGESIVGAWLENRGGRPCYIIRTVSNSGFHAIQVDAETGAFFVLDGEIGAPLGDPREDDVLLGQFRARAVATSGFGVDDAIKAAPFYSQGGVPFAAYFNLQESQLVISVEVLHGTAVERLDFNAVTGAMTLVDAAFDEPALVEPQR